MRTIYFYLYTSFFLIFSIPLLRKVKALTEKGELKKTEEIRRNLVTKSTTTMIKISGANVTVKGLENIPQNETVLFVGNHQSNFDIPLISSCIDPSISFVAKKELKKVPILGEWMKVIECIFLDRDNPRNAIKSINEGAEILKKGRSLFLFPEGTRSKSNKMGEFKTGGLKLAQKAGVKIIPVAIKNSYKLMEGNCHNQVKPAQVVITIGKPITVPKNQSLNGLSQEIKEFIEKKISNVD